VTETDVCACHACHQCRRCRKGSCCRRDDAHRRRPQLGDWDGHVYGDLGVLVAEEDGTRLICHACGQAYRNLGTHVVGAHKLLAFEYKAIFGLRATTSLLAPALAQRHREQHLATLSQFWGQAREVARSITPEQRSAYARGRTWALQARRDPANRPQWQRLMQGAQAGARAARAAGRRWWADPRAFSARGRARAAELRQDPEWVASWRQKYEAGRARSRDARQTLGHTPKPCIVCGTPVTQATGRRTCSDACEFRRAVERAADRPRAPKHDNGSPRLTGDATPRTRPGTTRVPSSKHCPVRAWTPCLSAYYALDSQGEAPPTLKQLAADLGLHAASSVQQVVRRMVAMVLNPAAADPTGVNLVACAVCGRQLYRRATGVDHAYSDACMAELRRRSRRRQQIREQARLEPLRRALEALAPAALSEHDRAILRLQFGLGGERVHTQDEIAEQLGLKQPHVSSVVRRLTTALLGWDAVDPEGRHRVTCSICGAITHVQRLRRRQGTRFRCGCPLPGGRGPG